MTACNRANGPVIASYGEPALGSNGEFMTLTLNTTTDKTRCLSTGTGDVVKDFFP